MSHLLRSSLGAMIHPSLHARSRHTWIFAAVILTLSTAWLLFSNFDHAPTLSWRQYFATDPLLEDTRNATLGFQRLFVINFPQRTDRSDKMSLMGALTGLHFEYAPAFWDTDVPDKAMPPDAQGWVGQVRGSWRGHINALRMIVEQNLTTAVIFEDDMDWDVRIRQQMYDYALTTRALTQPLVGTPDTFADPTFPIVRDPELTPDWLDSSSLPHTKTPSLSPYGDHWDLLHLGHCGMRRPLTKGTEEHWLDMSKWLPKGIVTRRNDPTVPKKENLHWWVDHIYGAFRRDFPEHTRVTHHALDSVCTFVYAVTQAGARKILYELGIKMMNDSFDLMLRDWCNGKRGHEGNGGICLTVQPSLFSHFIKNKKVEGQEGDPGFERTKNLRYSTWANIGKLLKGETDYEDQWPDND